MTTRTALLEEVKTSPRAMFLHTVRVKEDRSRERVFPRNHEISVCVWWGEVGAVLQAELPVFISNSLF